MTEHTDNTNRFFRGQMEDEELIAFSRKHWVSQLPNMIPFAFFLILVALTVMLLNKIRLPSLTDPFFQMLVMILIVASGWLIHRFFLRMINYYNNIVIITSHRIVEIKKTLFLRDTKESLDLRKVQEVEFKQDGLIANLFKFGSLNIILGNSEIKTLTQLPNPDYFFRLLNKLKNDMFVRPQRSLSSNEPLPGSNAAPSHAGEIQYTRPSY
jgi:hypothetical protein